MATSPGSSNFYRDVQISGSGNTQLGNSYHYGASEDQTILQEILRSLHYTEMGQRSHDVSEPGEDTFSWIYDERSDKFAELEDLEEQISSRWEQEDLRAERKDRSDSAARLRNWLQDDKEKVLWITGKPGSGKSALMKHIRDHEETDTLLQEWAGEHELITADHFFWLAGTAVQSSIEGMLRSLLRATLQHFAADIASAKAICSKKRWSLQTSHGPWSRRELKQTMTNLSRLPGICTFFLIDGLDECCPQHTHDQLMTLLSSLMQLPRCKYLVSSRPWHEFAMRFDELPTLRVDDLTRFDMLLYARAQLTEAALGQRSFTATKAELRWLSNNLARSAEGVFLWLKLVVRALEIEIKKCQGMRRLRQTMETIPHDLDEYFQKLIFERISSTSSNVSDTASVLKLALVLHDARDLPWHRSFIHFWLLSRGALESPISCALNNKRLDASRIEEMLNQTKAFLQQTCKDLLILTTHHASPLIWQERNPLMEDHTVQFCHRTVFDFLTGKSMQEAINSRSPSRFEEHSFISELICLQSIYQLLAPEIGCRAIEDAYYEAMRASTVVAEEHRVHFQVTCRSLAADHISLSDCCLGNHNIYIHTSANELDLNDDYLDDTYQRPFLISQILMRAAVQTWPYLAVGRSFYRGVRHTVGSLVLNPLECKRLCADCSQLMIDCLYRGFFIHQWLDSRYGPTIQDPSCSGVILRRGRSRARSKSLDRATRFDIQPCNCESCDTQLASSEDYGLRAAFLALEYAAYCVQGNPPVQADSRVAEDNDVKVRSGVLISLPLDLPESLTSSTSTLEAACATSYFRRFLRRRQALRAARSLVVSVKKQLHRLTRIRPYYADADDGLKETEKEVIRGWLNFLRHVAPSLYFDRHRPASLAFGTGSEYCATCGAQAFPASDDNLITVYICLDWDGFPVICQQCFDYWTQDRESGVCLAYLALDVSQDVGILLCPRIVGAVQRIIEWYLDNAASVGLAHTVSSDVLAARKELESFKDTSVYLADWR